MCCTVWGRGPAQGASPGVGVHACAVMRHSVWERVPVPAMRRSTNAATAARAAGRVGATRGTRPADPVGIRRPGGCMSPLARPWGRGWRGERGGLGAPRVRLAGAGAGARGPRPRGALGRDAAADGVAWKTACSVRTVSTGLPGTSATGVARLVRTADVHLRPSSAHPNSAADLRLNSAQPDSSANPQSNPDSSSRQSLLPDTQYNPLRAKNIPAAGGVLPLSVRTGWGLPAGGSRSTGSRSASGGSSHAERVVLRRYGGRLAASGTTRLRPDRYSWKAEGEARGHLRTDTLYNAPTARMFRPPQVIWIATNRVTAW